jgi:hypothetical protein
MVLANSTPKGGHLSLGCGETKKEFIKEAVF